MTAPAQRSFIAHPMAKLGLLIFSLFALWFGGWYAISHYADGKIADVIGDMSDRGMIVDCTNREISGFPFRIGVVCEAIAVTQKQDAYNLETGGLRTAAQLYAPGEFIAELDGPLQGSAGGSMISADWSSMRLFLDATLNGGFDLASLTFADLNLTADDATAKSHKGAVHFRPTPVNDGNAADQKPSLDGALRLDDLSASLSRVTLPPASIEADATLKEGYHDLIVLRRPLRTVLSDGAQIDIRILALTLPEGGQLAIAGPLSIDSQGLLSGSISIGVEDPESVTRWVEKVDPVFAQQMNYVTQAIAGMGKPATFGKQQLRAIVVNIDRGQARLGFIQLPEKIPPLFRN